MAKARLIILSTLATLVFLASFAYSADHYIPTSSSSETSAAATEVMDVRPPSIAGSKAASLVHLMLDLLDSDVEYPLNESSAIVLACSPFATSDPDNNSYQMASKISLGLKFSF